nr:MAG TPA: Cytosine specific methyltransferase [Caudoviricetes sp.]
MGQLTYGSLFAGVGGFDLGFDAAGWECKFQVEWDKNCQEVLKTHWANVPKFGDVREVNGAGLTPVDLISFGSPCQDLSVAGKRSGLDGDRSGLFFEGIRIIKEMRYATKGIYPKWAIWENVAGALTSNKGEDFGEVLNQMANIGALAIEWHILDAQWFGVPQRRRRVFVIACFDPATVGRCGEQILSVPEDSRGDIKKSRKKRKQTARTTETSVSEPIWYGKTGYSKYEQGGVSLSASDHKRPDMNFILEPYVKVVRSGARDSDGNLPAEVWRNEDVSPTLNVFDNTGESRSTVLIVDGTRVNDVRIYDDGIVPTLKHRMGTGGGQVPLVGIENDTVYSYDGYNNELNDNIYRTLRTGTDSADHIAIPIQGTIIGRSDTAGPQGKGFGEENDPSYTLDTTSQHGVMTPELVLRRLTPLECERLMGFPESRKNVTIELCVESQENLVFVETQNLKSQRHVLNAEKIAFIKNAKFVEENSSAKEVKTLKPVEVSVEINLGAGHIVLNKKQNNQLSNVSNVVLSLESLQASLGKNFVQLLVDINIALGKDLLIGKVESQQRKINLASLSNGKVYPILSGEETVEYARDVLLEIEQMIENSMFITYIHSLNSQKKDLILKILSSYVINVIIGYTHLLTETEYLSKINLSTSHGHTQFDSTGKKIADTNRYKMCGNAIASPVAEWIGMELKKWME